MGVGWGSKWEAYLHKSSWRVLDCRYACGGRTIFLTSSPFLNSPQELTGCQHTLIGDEEQGMKGISGGQKRRVSVGIELIKDPSVIFLDEPTSGLDSEMAVGVMSLLLRLAHEGGKTVVITIHQPNSLITAQFDDFMLLADGHCVYGGPWAGALPHFAAAGFSCPTYTNPTDYFLSVLKKPEDKELLIEFGRKQLTVGGDEGAPGPAAEEQGAEDAEPPSAAPEARWATQVWLLSKRMVLMWRRSPNMLFSELSQYLFLALFIGERVDNRVGKELVF